jgi:hypothetical protein
MLYSLQLTPKALHNVLLKMTVLFASGASHTHTHTHTQRLRIVAACCKRHTRDVRNCIPKLYRYVRAHWQVLRCTTRTWSFARCTPGCGCAAPLSQLWLAGRAVARPWSLRCRGGCLCLKTRGIQKIACRACSCSALASLVPRRMPVIEGVGDFVQRRNPRISLQDVQSFGPGISHAEGNACVWKGGRGIW